MINISKHLFQRARKSHDILDDLSQSARIYFAWDCLRLCIRFVVVLACFLIGLYRLISSFEFDYASHITMRLFTTTPQILPTGASTTAMKPFTGSLLVCIPCSCIYCRHSICLLLLPAKCIFLIEHVDPTYPHS